MGHDYSVRENGIICTERIYLVSSLIVVDGVESFDMFTSFIL